MLQYVYCGNVDVEKQEIDAFSKVLDSLKVEYDLEGSDDAEENDEEEEQSEHQQDFSTQADTSDHEQYINDNNTFITAQFYNFAAVLTEVLTVFVLM